MAIRWLPPGFTEQKLTQAMRAFETALGAGNAVIAHDNPYNRWVAGDGALYFSGIDDASDHITVLLGSAERRQRLAAASRARHAMEFTWEHVAGQYEEQLSRYVRAGSRAPGGRT